MSRSNLLLVGLTVLAVLVIATPALAQVSLINFETPSLGTDARRIVNPYVDAASGVSFTVEPVGTGDEVVGLVKNSATSACVDPPDANQKLGTGRSDTPDGSIGLSGFAIRATFPAVLPPPVAVSAEFQTGAGVTVRLRLFDASGAEVASAAEAALPADGTCGYPGDPRARKTLSVTSTQPVAYAIMDALPLDDIQHVFVIDNFEFQSTPPPPSLSSTYASTPPSIDGVVGFGEWQISNRLNFDHGFITALNDGIRLYILVDVLKDTASDSSDFFWLTFDVNRDRAITANLDLNYALHPDTRNMRYQFYLGPATWTGLQPDTRSSKGAGFGCFLADGTFAFVWPLSVICDSHRVWEFGIDLAEIGAQPGDTVNMGLRVASPNPSFSDDIPANFYNDFTNLIQVSLATLPAPIPPADPNASIRLESDAIELTQAIQDRANSLPLVADKRAAARLYVDVSGSDSAQPAIVYLYGSRGGVDLPGSPLAALFMAPPTIDRNQLNGTASFLLPDTWDNAGTIRFFGRVRDQFGNQNTSTPFDRAFAARDAPLYWVVPINTGTANAPNLASNAEIASQQSYLETIYPVPRVRVVRKSWEVIGATTVGDTIEELNDYYNWSVLAWVLSVLFTGREPFELPDQVYGVHTGGGGISDPIWYGGVGIVARGGVSPENIMAHEIDHNLDKSTSGTWGRHTPHDCGAAGPDPSWPYTNDDIQEVGFDLRLPWVASSVVPANYPDLMSYCTSGAAPTTWISPYRWNHLYSDAFVTAASSLAQLQADIQTVYYVSGELNVNGTGSLDPVLVQPGLPSEAIAPGDYSLEVQNAAGEVLLTTPFFASFINMDGEQVEKVYFNYRLPAQPGAAKLLLKHGDQILDTLLVSANAPSVAVLAPNGGESWAGRQTIRWSATDADGDALSFTILYTPDAGQAWFPVAGNVQGTSYEVNTAILPAGAAAKIRVLATDGFNTAYDDSDGTFTVADNAPQVTIVQPSAYAQFPSGAVISFQGDASDLEDGPLPDTSLAWSYGSTVFGVGRETSAVLPDGVHQITLAAVDSQGNQGSASLTLFVGVPLPQTSSITVRKEANDDGTDFNFTFDGQPFGLKNGQATAFGQLTPGLYTIAESLPTGWLLRQISCDNGLTLANPEPPEATLELQPDQDVVCTFSNERTTAIELISFTAEAGAGSVTLAWETAAEIDNEGFNLWRGEATDGPYAKLNASLIPAQGDPDTGAGYEYVDSDVVKGVTYYYKLEDVDLHGVSTFHGPLSATAGPIHPLYLPFIMK